MLNVIGRIFSFVTKLCGGNPRRFTCPHGLVTFCNTCVREDIVSKLGYVPDHVEHLL